MLSGNLSAATSITSASTTIASLLSKQTSNELLDVSNGSLASVMSSIVSTIALHVPDSSALLLGNSSALLSWLGAALPLINCLALLLIDS